MIQVKRGLRQNIPNPLSQGEFGWCTDTKELYMGTGTLNENQKIYGAPVTAEFDIYVASPSLGGRRLSEGATGLVKRAGTSTQTSAGKLIDGAANFESSYLNKTVHNESTDAWAKVVSVDSATQLTLSADIITVRQNYEIADALDNVPDAFSQVPGGFATNITLRVSPGTFADDITFIGKTPSGNFNLIVQGDTTGTGTTLSGTINCRQRITWNNLKISGRVNAYYGADIVWNNCATQGSSKLYVYLGSANLIQNSTVTIGNDPTNITSVNSTINKGYTLHVASTGLGGDDSTADGLAIASGTATASSLNKLIDSAASFTASLLGKTVYNSTDDAWAKITAVDSPTQLSISSDIMPSGKAYSVVSAFSTIQGAVNAIPGTVNCNTTIKLSNEVFREAVNIWGKAYAGSYSITVKGSKTGYDSGTASSASNPGGNGSAAYGLLNDTSKAWGVNAYQNYFVEITSGQGVGQIRAIHSNTATQLVITGRWDIVPNNTSAYRIWSPLTRITGANAGAETTPVRQYCFKMDFGQKGIKLDTLKIDYAGLANYNGGVLIFGGAYADIINCWIEGCNYWGVQCSASSAGSVEQTVFRLQNVGDIRVDQAGTFYRVKRCRLTGAKNRSINPSTFGSIFDIYESYIGSVIGQAILCDNLGLAVIDGYLEINGSSSHNIYISQQSQLFANAQYGARTTIVSKSSGGWGCLSIDGGFGVAVSGLTYSSNVSGTFSPTTTLTAGNN